MMRRAKSNDGRSDSLFQTLFASIRGSAQSGLSSKYPSSRARFRMLLIDNYVRVGRDAVMTLPRSLELRWQEEVIERWLNTPGIPEDICRELRAMLWDVRREMSELEHAGEILDRNQDRRAS